jgi:branched-chain amino acid transport system ATP-binding protein
MEAIEYISTTVILDKIPILRDIDFAIAEGSICAVIGPNGTGKSVLMDTCMGLHKYRGDIRLFGKSLRDVPTHKIGITYVPQENNIYRRLTVHDNIRLALAVRKSTADVDSILRYFPVLKERQRQVADTFSGGEARQLAIALALVNLQKVLLLDEPLTGLSPKVAKDVLWFIKEFRDENDLTVLISEQNLVVADIADRVCVLRGGKIREQFTAAEWARLPKEAITRTVFGGVA